MKHALLPKAQYGGAIGLFATLMLVYFTALLVIQMPLLPQGFQELFLAPNGNVLLNDRVHE